ncbi:hypothetical protein Q7P37_005080 [Cladosporium fusiforme]
MSRSSNDSAYSSWGRRKSGLFALSTLTSSTDQDATAKSPRTLKKHKKRASFGNALDHPDIPTASHDKLSKQPSQPSHGSPRSRRPSLSVKTKRPSSVFGSLKPLSRTTTDLTVDSLGEPLSKSATSTTAHSVETAMDPQLMYRSVLMHGEVQTSTGMFRKKKEYLVLTESSITRYKSQGKASEHHNSIPNPIGRSPTPRHGHMSSLGSASDLQTLSDSSGDKDGRVPLRQVVAVHRLDDGKPFFAVEICYLDEDSSHASVMALQFASPEERAAWLKCIRSAVSEARTYDQKRISTINLQSAARIIERANDYDPANCAVFKVVQRQAPGKLGKQSSTDDLSKQNSSVCFLAIGVHKVHIIPNSKSLARASTSSLSSMASQGSYGILTLVGVRVSSSDDTFELTFRQPLQAPRRLYLASSASHEIATRLHFAENFLRPEYQSRLLKFNVPGSVDEMLAAPANPDEEEHSCLHRTLTAYCVAYDVNPSNVRYFINYDCEDAPAFELLPPADKRRSQYSPLECLAIMRTLRYNETFGSISFAHVPLDGLNGLHDNYGCEHVCSKTKAGTSIKVSWEELERSCLLVQEVRAMAATSKRLRRMDFSGCITVKPPQPKTTQQNEPTRQKDIGCGIVEALFPLCRHQNTNVDWICLNGIYLSETDLDYLVGAAVEKACHFRAIELNRCGLTDRSLGMILDALRAQDNTLEAIEIAGNTARLNPATFDSQLGVFGFIRKLNLSYVSRTSGSEPLLQPETLLAWRLSELRLSGTTLNSATIDALSTYLAAPQSSSLHELYLDNSYLAGRDLATLLYSMMHGESDHRQLHLDISQNHITKDLEYVTQAISSGMAPSHLSMRAIEYREESTFRKVLNAITSNKSITYLDMSQTALPGAASDETCRAFKKLFAENDTIVELNLSGEESRLATSRFGSGINDALAGLKNNRAVRILHIEHQKLGIQGASTLAEVLKENETLTELYCDNNEIPLQGLTDLVNSIVDNTNIIHLPTMDDGRAAAFRSAEITMKAMEYDTALPASPVKASRFNTSSFAMKRGLASVRRTAQRASVYSPSFPALPRSQSNLKLDRNSVSSSMPPPRSRQASHTGPVPATPTSFTMQDIQTTHRLLTEQWDRQCYRLAQYLDRNWCVLHGLPVTMELPDEKFERPASVGSLGKVLAQVKYDTTPRAERAMYFDDETTSAQAHPRSPSSCSSHRQSSVADSPLNSGAEGQHKTRPQIQPAQNSFKHFLLDASPDVEDELSGDLKQLRCYDDSDPLDFGFDNDPETPRQATAGADRFFTALR